MIKEQENELGNLNGVIINTGGEIRVDEEFIKERIKRRMLEEDITADLILKDTVLDCDSSEKVAKRLIREVANSLRMNE